MRLCRTGEPGTERPAISTADGRLLDASSVVDDIDARVLAGSLQELQSAVDRGILPEAPPGRFGAPVAAPGKVVCIGLNYRDHAAESGAAIPDEPIVFLKTTDTVVGPDDGILLPRRSRKTDYEAELAVVLGGTARYLDGPDAAVGLVAGYVLSHDVSEREFQLERGGQWDKGKSCETFNPLGPWLVTADEVPDPQAIGLRLWVNGEPRQSGSTADMVFGVHHLVWYLSQFMVLRPGDVVNTGTPAGVALGRGDESYLRAGDVVELEADGLGRQRQEVRQG